jgi:hypothetical protein
MKKILFFVICSIFLFVSCDKIILDVEGNEADLQGKWQMDRADTVYYNFQKSLFQYQIYQEKDKMSYALGYYILQGDTAINLKLLSGQSSLSLKHLNWDTIYDATGQAVISKAFKIEKLTNKKLVLSSTSEILSFHKF